MLKEFKDIQLEKFQTYAEAAVEINQCLMAYRNKQPMFLKGPLVDMLKTQFELGLQLKRKE